MAFGKIFSSNIEPGTTGRRVHVLELTTGNLSSDCHLPLAVLSIWPHQDYLAKASLCSSVVTQYCGLVAHCAAPEQTVAGGLP